MKEYDVIVVGSGPGGYVTAIRASQLGLKTAVVEKESLGGVCLNWGCIPTKALLKSAQVFNYLKHAEDYGLKVKEYDKDFDAVVNRSRNVAAGMSKGVQFLMKKNKIDVIKGHGKILADKKISITNGKKTEEFKAKHIIIATGARSRALPSLPQDGKKVIGYREAMTLPKQPKKLIVVGSGAIGIEFAYFFNAMGTRKKFCHPLLFQPQKGLFLFLLIKIGVDFQNLHPPRIQFHSPRKTERLRGLCRWLHHLEFYLLVRREFQ